MFESDFVGDPEDRFCSVEAHMSCESSNFAAHAKEEHVW